MPQTIETAATAGTDAAAVVSARQFEPASERLGQIERAARFRRKSPDRPFGTALIPLFHAALLFLAGIVLAHFAYFRPGLLLAGLAPLAALAAVAAARAPRLAWAPMGALWLVLGVWSAEMEPEPGPNRALIPLADGLLRTVEGTVESAGPLESRSGVKEPPADSDLDAETEAAGGQIQRVDLELSAVEAVSDTSDALVPLAPAAKARIRLTVEWPARAAVEFHCGERLRAVLRMLPADVFHDPGVWSRADYLASEQIGALASVKGDKRDGGQPRLGILGENGPNSPPCLLNRWRDAASLRLESLPALTRWLPKPIQATREDAAMLAALATGDRTYLTRSLRAGFERTGTFHLMVVSGLHLAILAGWVFALARRLRLPGLWATGATLAVTLAYALFTGFGLPAQRSFWMIALYLVGRLLYRGCSALNAIGFAALCLAAASPRSVFDASFQMTLLAVAAIAGIALPLLERNLHARVKASEEIRLVDLDPKLGREIAQFRVALRLVAEHVEAAFGYWIAWRALPWAVRILLRVGALLFVTLVVELALALPMAIYFHRIAVYALPANLLILPLLGVLVPAAMLLVAGLSLWWPLAMAPAGVCLAILHFSTGLVRGLGGLSLGDVRVPGPAAIQVAAALLLFVLALGLARGAGWRRGAAFIALLSMAVSALWPRAVEHPAQALLVEAIDVGQGDSLLLIAPDGKTLLVDGGGLGFFGGRDRARLGQQEFDVGEEVVSPALWARGIRRLDAVALTHAHHDHMGGLPAILRNFRPRELWVGNNPPAPAYRELLRQAAALGVGVRAFHAGEGTALGAAEIRVLAPDASYRPGAQPANNDSLVLKASFGATSILLEGDAEAAEERSMLAAGGLRSTVLKVGHHGSRSSTQPEFLAAVAPEWAVISCGRRNRFGHPRAEVLAELQAAHARSFRTDIDGASCLLLDGHSVAAEPLCVHGGR